MKKFQALVKYSQMDNLSPAKTNQPKTLVTFG